MFIPVGNNTINASLPAYNGWNYNVSIIGHSLIGESEPSNVSFQITVPPLIPPTPVGFGVVSVEQRTATFAINWLVNYADIGINFNTILCLLHILIWL